MIAPTAFIGGIGPWELGIVLAIVLILFGAGKLPQVFESFGKGIKAQKDDALDVTSGQPLSKEGE
jgi:sec-independent protein translocase protein TatA